MRRRPRRTKYGDQTELEPCIHCGKGATRFNSAHQPACTEHYEDLPAEKSCPVCSMPMTVRKGKFGYFWGCKGFPLCDKTIDLRREFRKKK